MMQRIDPSYLSPVQYSVLPLTASCTLSRLTESLILATPICPLALHLLDKSFPLHVSVLRW